MGKDGEKKWNAQDKPGALLSPRPDLTETSVWWQQNMWGELYKKEEGIVGGVKTWQYNIKKQGHKYQF